MYFYTVFIKLSLLRAARQRATLPAASMFLKCEKKLEFDRFKAEADYLLKENGAKGIFYRKSIS